MIQFDADEARHQSHEARLTDLEQGPYYCTECEAIYNSREAAVACADRDLDERE